MEKIYLTVEDENGELLPRKVLWEGGEKQYLHQPEIDKFMKKAKGEGLKLVEVVIIKK